MQQMEPVGHSALLLQGMDKSAVAEVTQEVRPVVAFCGGGPGCMIASQATAQKGFHTPRVTPTNQSIPGAGGEHLLAVAGTTLPKALRGRPVPQETPGFRFETPRLCTGVPASPGQSQRHAFPASFFRPITLGPDRQSVFIGRLGPVGLGQPWRSNRPSLNNSVYRRPGSTVAWPAQPAPSSSNWRPQS
jgi:hypothetical protein